MMPETISPALKTAATKFVERIYFEDVGISAIHFEALSEQSTLIKPVKSRLGHIFLKSDKALDRAMNELRVSVPTVRGREVPKVGMIVHLPINDAEDQMRAAIKRLGIEVIGLQRLAVSISLMTKHVIAMIDRLDRTRQLKVYNAEYRGERLKAKERGEKMPPYYTWLIERIGFLLKSGAASPENFKLFIPEISDT